MNRNRSERSTDERMRGVCVSGESLRHFRMMREMTQAELARRAGYSERLVRKAEAGGSISQAAIADLADALSCDGAVVTSVELCNSPAALARVFVDSFDEHELLMLDYCGYLLADNFVFHCAGDSDSCLSGDWQGAEGLQAWLEQWFSIVSRPHRKCLEASYMTAEDRVSVHYSEILVARDESRHSMWVNLHFKIRQGRIERIDNEFDTFLAAKLDSNGRVTKPK